MKYKQIIFDLLLGLFILLFGYAGTNKLIYFKANIVAMEKQPFNKELAHILAYVVPISEVIVVILLLLPTTRKLGLYIFTLMMVSFAGYIGLVLAGAYKYIPCSCGGIFREMGWTSHLIMNIAFVIGGIWAIYLSRKNKFDSTEGNKKSAYSLG